MTMATDYSSPMPQHLPPDRSQPRWNEVTQQVVVASTLSNQDFLEMFARPGRLGLACRPLPGPKSTPAGGRPSPDTAPRNLWSHAFVFEGRRVDACQWVVSANPEFESGTWRVHVGENRVSRFFEESAFHSLAVTDFKVSDDQLPLLLQEGLEMVARRDCYSLKDLMGGAVALRRPSGLRPDQARLWQTSVHCSAFLAHLLNKLGIEILSLLRKDRAAMEDFSRVPYPHMTYLLRRTPADAVQRAKTPPRRR